MTTYLDLHVLQSVPPSNLNRDDTGSPKSAFYGGVNRARVSSQAWKKAVRDDFKNRLDTSELGVRTKRLVSSIADRAAELDPALDETAPALAAEALGMLGIKVDKPKRAASKDDEQEASPETGYLVFLSAHQIENIARHIVDHASTGESFDKKELVKLASRDASIDLALFGRMVAEVTDLKVDAAAQVAHAISVHAVDSEFDYFTAVDDHAVGDHAGAGMIGTIEFNSSTLYRYATVNIDALQENLGDRAATIRGTQAFIESFLRSMPSGKQNTFANRTLPQAVYVALRTDQPINLAGAFESPVIPETGESMIGASVAALVAQAQAVDAAFGQPEGMLTWTVAATPEAGGVEALGPVSSLSDVVTAIADALESA